MQGCFCLNSFDNLLFIEIPIIKNKIDIIIATYTDSITAIKRDYLANLSLEERRFLNEENINEFNKSLLNLKDL